MATTTYNVFSNVTEGDISLTFDSNYTIQLLTQTEYDAIADKSNTTLYCIREEDEE